MWFQGEARPSQQFSHMTVGPSSFCPFWPRNLPLCLNDFLYLPHINYLESLHPSFVPLSLHPPLHLGLSLPVCFFFPLRFLIKRWTQWPPDTADHWDEFPYKPIFQLLTCIYGFGFFLSGELIDVCMLVRSFGPPLYPSIPIYTNINISWGRSI